MSKKKNRAAKYVWKPEDVEIEESKKKPKKVTVKKQV